MATRQTAKATRPAGKKSAGAKRSGAAAKRAGDAVFLQSGPAKPKKGAKLGKRAQAAEQAQVLSSEVVYRGPLFRVERDRIVEPTGLESEREIVRHNGSAVILAVDRSKNKKDPWIVMERQYRHAANQFLWEIPAGKLEAGEAPLEGAKRELAEETGYQAKKWRPLVTYYASPGFLGEAMIVFLAEDLEPCAVHAAPDEDERIELRLVRLSEILKMIEKGAIHDGKTLTSVLLYAWMMGRKRKK